jgi:uncharacterized protein (TIGR02996 family)
MSDEAAFLRSIQDSPADDAPRLVYADWLDERGDTASAAKAAFLRTTAAHGGAVRARARGRKALKQQLHEMARALPKDWLTIVSQVPVENCSPFEFECPKRWESLGATDDPAVRYCDSCRQSVYYAQTIEEAKRHAWIGRCVAVQLGLPRKKGDLERETVTMGILIDVGDDRPWPGREESDPRRERPDSE